MNNVGILTSDTALRLIGPVTTADARIVHRGEIVESVARRSHTGLSEISGKIRVSRQTMYSWFKNPILDMADIIKIGAVIEHDFSGEFPALANEEALSALKIQDADPLPGESRNQAMYYWMEKYIRLLEGYNEILCCKSDRFDSSGHKERKPVY
ncbi:hypothetical protein [Mucilaginibacter kameinonensis]|uniref:hypothetical protein n=1 Tax=Mucilaginibacter kameinonensis TaxID=452286 RepID=UPI000EF8146A|nr:hypothetical protein [Mucilaginibacter kameinonensis]